MSQISPQLSDLLQSGELADLRWHWGPAYVITAPCGMFRAERRDDGAAISCVTAAGLRMLIRDDYAARPIPRGER